MTRLWRRSGVGPVVDTLDRTGMDSEPGQEEVGVLGGPRDLLSRAATSAEVPAFCRGGEYTVGAEEELMLVDGDAQLLGADAVAVLDAVPDKVSQDGLVKGEIFQDQVELSTRVCADAEELIGSLRALRSSLIEAGVRPMAVGVHPSAGFDSALMATSLRYDRTVDEYAGLFRTPTASLQVHVGMPSPGAALLAYRGLRNRLSLIRALAASSPYWHGYDSGLASARSAITRSYPRTTVPPVLRSWDEYAEMTARITAATEVPDYTYVWWEMRPQPPLGTLEVRVMDAQHSLAAIAGLTALIQGLARHAVEVPDIDDLPDDVAAANDFRACRHGLDTRILDLDGSLRPLREVAVRALAEARSMLAPDGLDAPLEVVESMLVDPLEPARQRRLCEEHGMSALLADLVSRTSDLQS